MSRGHICVSSYFPQAPQEKALAAAGVKTIYINDIESATRSLRKGEALEVHTFRGLATNRKAIDAALDAIHDRGAHVIDATTRRRSDSRYGAKLMSEAVASLSMERQGGKQGAKKHGRAGGIASGKAKAAKQMPRAIMEKIWFNKALDRDEVMERINGAGYLEISYSGLHKRFGPRGVPVGRRPREK